MRKRSASLWPFDPDRAIVLLMTINAPRDATWRSVSAPIAAT